MAGGSTEDSLDMRSSHRRSKLEVALHVDALGIGAEFELVDAIGALVVGCTLKDWDKCFEIKMGE